MQASLRRYTDLPALLTILQRQRLTLLDPATWDDANDAFYLTEYKRIKGLASLFALCFSQKQETYHHWKVFAGVPAGVCIRIHRSSFLQAITGVSGLTANTVTYRTLAAARRTPPTIEQLPFIKRAAFKDEDEFRLVYESAHEKTASIHVPVSLDIIERITLSPWLHESLAEGVRAAVQSITGCQSIEVFRSSIRGDEEWRRLAEHAA